MLRLNYIKREYTEIKLLCIFCFTRKFKNTLPPPDSDIFIFKHRSYIIPRQCLAV